MDVARGLARRVPLHLTPRTKQTPPAPLCLQSCPLSCPVPAWQQRPAMPGAGRVSARLPWVGTQSCSRGRSRHALQPHRNAAAPVGESSFLAFHCSLLVFSKLSTAGGKAEANSSS